MHVNLLHEYEGKDELEGQEEVVRRLYQTRWVWSDTVVKRKYSRIRWMKAKDGFFCMQTVTSMETSPSARHPREPKECLENGVSSISLQRKDLHAVCRLIV